MGLFELFLRIGLIIVWVGVYLMKWDYGDVVKHEKQKMYMMETCVLTPGFSKAFTPIKRVKFQGGDEEDIIFMIMYASASMKVMVKHGTPTVDGELFECLMRYAMQ